MDTITEEEYKEALYNIEKLKKDLYNERFAQLTKGEELLKNKTPKVNKILKKLKENIKITVEYETYNKFKERRGIK